MEHTLGDAESARVEAGGGRWGDLMLVGLILGVTQLGYYLTASALPLYLRDLGAAQGHIGFEVGLGNIVGVAATLVFGPALDRYGTRVFLVLSALLYVVAAAGMLLVDHEYPVTVFRTLQGVGSAMILPASMTLAAGLVPRRTGTALGVMGALNSFSLAAGPPIGLTLYTGYGRTGLLVPALVAAVLGLFAVWWVPRTAAEAPHATGLKFDRGWLLPVVANGLAAVYFGGIIAYLPLHLRALHGPNAGLFFTADAIGVLLLRVPTGWLADHRGSFLPKLLGLVLTLPGILVLGLSPSVATLVAAGSLTGIGAGLFITGIYADMATRSTPANRGTALSLSASGFGIGIFLGSAISGLFVGPGGFNAVLILGVVTCVAAFPLALFRLTTTPSGGITDS